MDTPNTVLRRILGLEKSATPSVTRQPRARSDELLPHAAYRPALLEALAERGGLAPAREITIAVGEKLRDQFKPRDLEPNNSGVIRWENRVAWQRLRLKEQGLIKSGSPEGIWELTEAGQEEAANLANEGGELSSRGVRTLQFDAGWCSRTCLSLERASSRARRQAGVGSPPMTSLKSGYFLLNTDGGYAFKRAAPRR